MSIADHETTFSPENRTGTAMPQPLMRSRSAQIWVLCRRSAGNGNAAATENVRAYDDESRARADLELAESVSEDEFWLSAVPLLETQELSSSSARMSSVQRLALTWMAQGAEAEVPMPDSDPVVISPRHVRGFVSVPPDEWLEMEERGWVRNGMITPEGTAQIQGQT